MSAGAPTQIILGELTVLPKLLADPIPAIGPPGLETICLPKYVSLNPPMINVPILSGYRTIACKIGHFTEQEFSEIFSLAGGGNFALSKREFPVALGKEVKNNNNNFFARSSVIHEQWRREGVRGGAVALGGHLEERQFDHAE